MILEIADLNKRVKKHLSVVLLELHLRYNRACEMKTFHRPFICPKIRANLAEGI